MAPKTRNAKSCEGCGIGMVRVGKGEEEECASIWCQKCWGLSVASLEDRVKELENTSGEREDSFKECCECDELRAKVVELEKYGLNSSNDRCRKLEEEMAKCKEEINRNENLICEITELRIKEGKMKVTIDEYGHSLAVKEDLVRKMIEVREEMKQEKMAFELQGEEFKKVIKRLEERLGDSSGAGPCNRGDEVIGSETREKGRVSLGAEPSQTKEKGTGWTRVGKAKGPVEATRSRQSGVMDNTNKVGKQRAQGGKRQVGNGRIKDKIVVIGSSMVRNVERNVSMKEKGSYSRSIRGAGIKEIMSEAVEAAIKTTEKTLLFIEGGGNSLKCLGVEETVRSVVEGVRDINRENKNLWTVVLSVIPRPRENWRYENARLEVNERLFEEVIRLHKEGVKVTFMNLDPGMNLECFAEDQVHFNDKGNRAMGKVIISVINRSAMIDRRVVQQPQ